MLFRRIHHDGLAQSSYLIACQTAKVAIVIDPLRDPAPYVEAARREGVRITHVTETHVHADFLSGAVALAAAAGAELLLSGEAQDGGGYVRSAFPAARWLSGGDLVSLGTVRLEVMHVPGHTPEHLAFLVSDLSTTELPMGLVSGDFLFVGDVGRPDLLERSVGVRGTMERSARQLFDSLRRLREVPDYVQLWPGHGAGSACGKALGAVPQSTIGYERLTNWAFAIDEEAVFVAEALRGQPEPPVYFARMKRSNAGGAPALPPARPSLSDEQLVAALKSGALAVDVRPAPVFAGGHVPGAVSVPIGRSFLIWAGSVLPHDRDLVLLTSVAERGAAEAAVRELRLIGFDRVVGVLALERASELYLQLDTLPSIAADSVGPEPVAAITVLDVRNQTEWEAGHIPGATHIALAELASRVDELRNAGPIVVHCQGGSRSAVAASLLRSAGLGDVSNMTGGYSAWARQGHDPATGN